MTTTEQAIAEVLSGARVYLRRDEPNGITALQWTDAEGDLWQLSVRGPDDTLQWIQRLPARRYELAKHVPGDAAERLCAPGEVPAALWDRARRIPSRAREALAALRAGGGWLRAGGAAWWAHDARLGDLAIEPGPPARLAATDRVESSLPEALWNDPALTVTAPPGEAAAQVAGVLDAVADEQARVLAGELAVVDRTAIDGQITAAFAVHGALLWLSLERDHPTLPERVRINPRIAVVPPQRLREVLFERRYGRSEYERRWGLEPVPPEARAVEPELARGLARTRREVIDAYLAAMRTRGMTLSGGPTSDQSWTINWEGEEGGGGGFWIAGYTYGRDGELERTRDPISEARVREMLATYEMFGLSELPE